MKTGSDRDIFEEIDSLIIYEKLTSKMDWSAAVVVATRAYYSPLLL
jgi:hypothetical protein